MRFRIREGIDNDSLVVHPDIASQRKIPVGQPIWLYFGMSSKEMKSDVSSDLPKDEILVPSRILMDLRIPACNPYELKVVGNQLILGPFIGILSRTDWQEGLTARLDKFSMHYPSIGGTLTAFHLRDMNESNQTIEGLIYNQETEQWEKGIFPYPSSIIRTVGLPPDHYLYSLYGERITNQRGFHKWELHQQLSQIKSIRDYLPHSALYQRVEDIAHFLQLYKAVYLKPISGGQGKGIIKIRKGTQGFIIQWREGENQVKTYRTKTLHLPSCVERKLARRKYMIQQAIDLMSYENRLIDFRVIIAKDRHGEWRDYGMIGKYGKTRSIVSNVSSGGIAEMGEVTLRKAWKLTDDQVQFLRQQVSHMVIEIAKQIEKIHGVPYGDFGMDIGIDKNRRLWLIEVNDLGDATIVLDAGKDKLYHEIMQTYMLYAKRIAVFYGNS